MIAHHEHTDALPKISFLLVSPPKSNAYQSSLYQNPSHYNHQLNSLLFTFVDCGTTVRAPRIWRKNSKFTRMLPQFQIKRIHSAPIETIQGRRNLLAQIYSPKSSSPFLLPRSGVPFVHSQISLNRCARVYTAGFEGVPEGCVNPLVHNPQIPL